MASLANFLNFRQGVDNVEGAWRAGGAVILGLLVAPRSELDQIVDSLLPSASFIDWGVLRDTLPPQMKLAVALEGAAALGTGIALGVGIAGTTWGIDQVMAAARATENAVQMVELARQAAISDTVDIAEAGVKACRDAVAYAAHRIADLARIYDQSVDYTADRIADAEKFYRDAVVWTADQFENVAKLYGATDDAATVFGARIKAEGERAATSGLDTLKQFVDGSLNRLERTAAGPGLVLNGLTAIESLRGFFSAAEASAFMSPIMLDLDGNGVNSTSLSNSGAFFDLDANGFAENAGWVSAGDGLLVLDRNNNGRIDSGRELFGNTTVLANGQTAANGFEALSELDTNSDGTVDASDSSFADLKIWKDANGDGFSMPDELIALADAGVQSIGVGYTDSNFVDSGGNQHRQVGSFTRADGTAGDAVDVWVNRDLIDTVAEDRVVVPADIATLPDLQGYGNVRSLHQAMVRDQSSELKALVETFSNETNEADRRVTLEQILFKWADAGNDTNGGTTGMSESRLVVLERFFGQTYSNTVQGRLLGLTADYSLLQAYQGVQELFYSQLMAQTHLKNAFDAITNRWDSASHSLKLDVSGTAQWLGALYAHRAPDTNGLEGG